MNITFYKRQNRKLKKKIHLLEDEIEALKAKPKTKAKKKTKKGE